MPWRPCGALRLLNWTLELLHPFTYHLLFRTLFKPTGASSECSSEVSLYSSKFILWLPLPGGKRINGLDY
jgi:hypothetical protein